MTNNQNQRLTLKVVRDI